MSERLTASAVLVIRVQGSVCSGRTYRDRVRPFRLKKVVVGTRAEVGGIQAPMASCHCQVCKQLQSAFEQAQVLSERFSLRSRQSHKAVHVQLWPPNLMPTSCSNVQQAHSESEASDCSRTWHGQECHRMSLASVEAKKKSPACMSLRGAPIFVEDNLLMSTRSDPERQRIPNFQRTPVAY